MQDRIRILFTSDVHGAVMPYSYADGAPIEGSFARLATCIAELRDENTLLIDGGDTLQGSPLSFYHQRALPREPFPATRAMKALGYDFLVLGNHDFDYGVPALKQHIHECGATTMRANVVIDDLPQGAPFELCELAGVRIALIGVTTHATVWWEDPASLKGITFTDAFETLKQAAETAHAQAQPDYVIAVYHGGFTHDPNTGECISLDSGENQATRMLTQLDGIDVLLTAHQHRIFCGSTTSASGKPMVYVQPGQKGCYCACIDINTTTRAIDAQLIPVDTRVSADERIPTLITQEEHACQEWLDQPLGKTKLSLGISNALEAKVHKSQLVTFLNMVQLDATGAQLSASALFPGTTGFPSHICMRDLVSTYTFSNTLVVKRIGGIALRAYLEKCAEYFSLDRDGNITVAPAYKDPPQDFNYDMVDGIAYTINVAKPHGARIVKLTYRGVPIQPDDEFTLVVNNYRAAGGGDFPMIAQAPTVAENVNDMVELIANYILKHTNIDFEPINNIRVIASKE